MANTFLTHRSCGGSVVLDASKQTKLYAPSFSISLAGLGNLALDVQVDAGVSGAGLTPVFYCITCCRELTMDELKTDVDVLCQICGKPSTVDETGVHSHIATVCDSCKDEIRTGDSRKMSSRTSDYVSAFGLTKTMRTVPLFKILNNPITL